MKYIKQFESLENKYWVVNLKRPNFEIALKKIDVPEYYIKQWLDMYVDDDISAYVFKILDTVRDRLRDIDEYVYHWYVMFSDNSERTQAQFMGRVDAEDWEIDSFKYNL